MLDFIMMLFDVGHEELGMSERRAVSGWNLIGLAMLALAPGVVLYLVGFESPDPIRALLYGITIIGAAFVLSWAAEVVQMDFSQSLALALLALIAILPEYIVDGTFAWLAAEDPAYAGYAVANMTGANRLLIGIAWPLVVLLAFLRFRRRFIELEEGHGFELVVLLAATLYAFILPFKGSISLIDLAFLVGLFVFYIWRIARIPAEQPHLVGPARLIGEFSPYLRRTVTAIMALVAAAAILLVAKPFATSLVATGVNFGIDEFLLVQWLAPLASESPEFVVVALFAWRGAATPALGTLVSSKINQWTLLVAMLPLIYSIALGAPEALPLDSRQREEVFLTAAQSLFAVALLLDLRLSMIGAGILFILFVVQAAVPEIRIIVSIIYLVFAVIALIISRHHLLNAFRWVRSKEA
jgi:cation:H+ antiporter